MSINKLAKAFSGTFVLLAALVVMSPLAVVHSQIKPVYDRGIMGLGQALKRLNRTASVLMIGAHPDDEDTALLSYLARGENARTAYLSLTRGDGGQNILGPELGEALGLIRTEELIQARKLDGAQQFFTRAYDYGFSKTLAEARGKWDEKIILCDAVRIIREFRPLVVVSQFSGTPLDGHGQHQYAGYISPLAVKAAADPAQCTASGNPWQVRKFYMRHRGTGEPRLRINTGKYDPLLGRSYFEIAMEARSQHRSQEQGVLELHGQQSSSLNLAGSDAKEAGIFDGIAIMVYGGSETAKAISDAASAAESELDIHHPEKILPHLVKGYRAAASLGATEDSTGFYRTKQLEFAEAIRLAAGIQIDALTDRETVVPGDSIPVAVKTFVGAGTSAKTKAVTIIAPNGWTVTADKAPGETGNQGFVRREAGDFAAYYSVAVPATTHPTTPYWLVDQRDGDVFRWNENDPQRGLPFHRPLPAARVEMTVLDTPVVFEQPVEFRYADDTRGEIRRIVQVVPSVSIDIDQPLMIVPANSKAVSRQIVMTITNRSDKPVTGTVGLNISSETDWPYKVTNRTFDLKKLGETATMTFDVTIPAKTKPGSYQINGNAMIGESLAQSAMHTITYPHIQTHRIYRRAATDVKVFDLKVAPVKVGYVSGSGDRVPEAIKQMGLSVDLLDEKQIATGNLAGYDVIVVGIRASEVRADFVASNQRLLEYAKNGGTLIVQYQRPVYASLAPYPVQMGSARVAEENADVKILQPEHSIFNFPNKITEVDFMGWVQERNLYNFTTMDAKYTGLIESHDSGEAENKGGLVVANIGKGRYVYCSYSFFRQLPAGVSGAYRLFANLISLPKAKK